MSDTLQARAALAFDEMNLAALPGNLQRNSLRHYYLSIWPPITSMRDYADSEYPAYPDTVTNLYMHVPFCSGACSFCNYYFQVTDPSARPGRIASFLADLRQDVALHAERADIRTSYLYVGGGTPSLIPPEQLASFFEWMRAQEIFADSWWGTVELHPELFRDLGAASEFLDACRRSGIGRVSLGIQELSGDILRDNNRRHGVDLYERAIGLIGDKGLIHNLDLMYGMPGQSKDDWERTLRFAASQQPDSISIYFLFLNGKTALAQRVASGRAMLPPYREVQELHIMAQLFLEESGYCELPSDFFSKHPTPGLKERTGSLPSAAHVLPIGPGSYGYFDQTQFTNHFSEDAWREAVRARRRPIWRGHRHSAGEAFRRDLMFSLKNSFGIDLGGIAKAWGDDAVNAVTPLFDLLLAEELVVRDPAGLSLSRKGRLCAEEIAWLFSPPLPEAGSSSASSRKAAAAHSFSPSYR